MNHCIGRPSDAVINPRPTKNMQITPIVNEATIRRPMLRNPKAKGKPLAYTVVSRRSALGKAIRTDRWRYARWPDGEELYDLKADPREWKNLAKSIDHTATLKKMRSLSTQIDKRAASRRRSK